MPTEQVQVSEDSLEAKLGDYRFALAQLEREALRFLGLPSGDTEVRGAPSVPTASPLEASRHAGI